MRRYLIYPRTINNMYVLYILLWLGYMLVLKKFCEKDPGNKTSFFEYVSKREANIQVERCSFLSINIT